MFFEIIIEYQIKVYQDATFIFKKQLFERLA